MKISDFSIDHHVGVLVLCVGLLVVGASAYVSLPRESFPDVQIPHVFVTTSLRGANPTDVETSLTVPLETELDGTEGVKELRSSSHEGLSMIDVEFYPEVPTEVALQRVRDAVDRGKGKLPSDADEPVVREFSFSSIPILIYHLIGDDQVSRSELQKLADKLKDRLKLIRGVLDVEVYGGREEAIIIEVDPERLHFYQLSIAQVQQVLRGTNENVSVGTSESLTQRIVMRVPGEFRAPGEILDLVIGGTVTGVPIYLKDVAMARYGYEDEASRSRAYDFAGAAATESAGRPVPGRKSVSLHLTKRTGENILRIADDAAAVMQTSPLPASVRVLKGMDQSKDVRMMVSDLENGFGTALILVVGVIFLAMGIRNAILVSVAVPLSMLMGVALLQALGETLNMVVLFALVLVLGMLVDNAIVIVENIYRHYCMGDSRLVAAKAGTQEVAWPVITSTLTTVGAFLPLMFWPGIMGEFMYYLPETVNIVLLCSLFVALVINPTLAALLMRRPAVGQYADPETFRPKYWLVVQYQKVLEFMLRRPGWTLTTAFTLLLLTICTYAVFGAGMEFFPRVDPNTATCGIKPPDGCSLVAADRLAQAAEDRFFGALGSGYKHPVANLKDATVTVSLDDSGGGFFGDNGGPVSIQVDFIDREFRTERTAWTIEEMRRRLDGLDPQGKYVTWPLYGAEYNVARPQEGPPTGKALSVNIFGTDLNQMTSVIVQMKRLIVETPGAAKPTDDAATAQPTLEWSVDRARAGVLGLEQMTVSSVLQMTVGGLRTGTFGHGDDERDIILRLPEEFRLDTGRLHHVYVPSSLTGGSVPIASVASAELVPGPVSVRHLNRRRVLTAGAEVQAGIRADATIREAFQQQVRQLPLPPGVSYSFGGAAEEQEAAQRFLSKAFVVAVLIIVLILVVQFNSVWKVGIIMCSVVLSVQGVLFGLLVLNEPFGIIMTGIAVISLAGVVVNNAIVLLDAVRIFEERGNSPYDAIVTAVMIRFRPVLLTAGTTVLGLIPMALKINWDFAGWTWQYNTDSAQFWQSMATSLCFGMCVASILTLGVVPCLYLICARWRDRLRQAYPPRDD